MDYVREIVSHSEYGDALENLTALGSSAGKAFTRDQVRRIQAIADAIGVDVASLPGLRNASAAAV